MPTLQAARMGKRYGNQWVLRHITLDIPPHTQLAITGGNGSGKSTLLKLLAAAALPTEGTLHIHHQGKKIPPDQLYKYISWAAPYIQAPQQLRLDELYQLHFRFRHCLLPSVSQCLETLDLQAHARKHLWELSSGLLQRYQLGLALFTDAPILMLDEPTSFLDEDQRSRMLDLIRQHSAGRTLLLASNDPREYAHISQRAHVQHGKLISTT